MNIRRIVWLSVVLAWLLGCRYACALDTVTVGTLPAYALGGSSVEYLEDPQRALTIADVTQPAMNARFVSSARTKLNFGFTDSAYWLRFRVRGSAASSIAYLELGYPPIDRIELYVPHGDAPNGFHLSTVGDHLPFSAREINHRNYVFRVPVQAQNELTIYMRVETEGSFTLPLTLWTAEGFADHVREEHLLLGLYYGILFALFFYNLVLFFTLKDRTYLHYVGVLVTNALTLLSVNGLASQYLWPDAVRWANLTPVIFLELATFMACDFTRVFLATKINTPRLDRLLLGFMGIEAVLMVGSVALPYSVSARIASVLSNVVPVVIIVTTLLCQRKGYRPARYFLISWSAYLLGLMIQTVRNFGILPSHFLTIYGLQIGSVIEMLLLSLAVADRFHIFKAEKESAQAFAVETLKQSERELEHKVAARTQELSEANHNLNEAVHRLARLDREKNEFFGIVAHDLKAPLTGMTLMLRGIQAQLPKLGVVEAQQRLGEFRRSLEHTTDIVRRLLHINRLDSGDLRLHTAAVDLPELVNDVLTGYQTQALRKSITLHVGLPAAAPVNADREASREIVDNLLSNAIKYSPIGGNIYIDIVDTAAQVWLKIRDQGPGFTSEDQQRLYTRFARLSARPTAGEDSTGLGLSIVKKLVDAMNLTIRCETVAGEGTAFILEFAKTTAGDPLDQTTDR